MSEQAKVIEVDLDRIGPRCNRENGRCGYDRAVSCSRYSRPSKDCPLRKGPVLVKAKAPERVCPSCGGGNDAEPGPEYHCPKCDAAWSVVK